MQRNSLSPIAESLIQGLLLASNRINRVTLSLFGHMMPTHAREPPPQIASARAWLAEALSRLSDREKLIIHERRLVENGVTLESLGRKLGVSKERVRQIEVRAFEKLQKANQRIATEKHLIPA
jgi:DNA-directed RNA polymerase specialized sigma24 family protein